MTTDAFAKRLKEAYGAAPVAPLRTEAADTSPEAAYAIQQANTKAWLDEGRRLVGRKIGLTSKAVQQQLGVDQPDYGMLYADSSYCSGDMLPASRFLQPKVEAEIAFILKRGLVGEDITITDVMGAVDYAVAGIEIVDSRIANWDISLFDTIADNASYGAFVLGTRPVPLTDLDLEACTMTMTAGGEQVSSGVGSACLGNPLLATLWLARVMAKTDFPLMAGDVVLSGALGPMVAVEAGTEYEATIDGLGSVRIAFS